MRLISNYEKIVVDASQLLLKHNAQAGELNHAADKLHHSCVKGVVCSRGLVELDLAYEKVMKQIVSMQKLIDEARTGITNQRTILYGEDEDEETDNEEVGGGEKTGDSDSDYGEEK
jgi:hypothetical protein